MQILIFISLQIVNNITLEEISVVLFHKLLSQFATSRLRYQFLHFMTAVTLCSYFSFALPPTLFLILLPNTPAQRNAITSCTTAGQPQQTHLQTEHRDTHIPAATPLHWGTGPQPQEDDHPPAAQPLLAEEPEPHCIFKPSRWPC